MVMLLGMFSPIEVIIVLAVPLLAAVAIVIGLYVLVRRAVRDAGRTRR